MRMSMRLLVFGTLVLGCGGTGLPGPSATGGEGGSGGDPDTGGTGGKVVSGGGAGSGGAKATGGAGGSVGAAGAGGDTGGAGGTATPADAGTSADSAAPGPDAGEVIAGAPPYGCTGCTRLFDGKTLAGWDTAPGYWVVKEGGVLASTGKAADIYTHEDLGDYRIFFQIRHLPAMGGGDHQACTVLFGKRPASPTAPARGLGGAQFQPPNGYSWDYGVGGTFTNPPGKMKLDAKQWNQCEIIVKEAGSFRAACCAVGPTPCKSFEVLSWKGPGRKHPFDIMMHNAGLFDEYREIWIERSPKEDVFLSGK